MDTGTRKCVFLIILIALLSSCGRTTPPSAANPTAAATAQPTSLPSAAPSVAPLPTATAALPAAAPVPSATAAPTVAPTPTAAPLPTGAPDPTLTHDDRVKVVLINERAGSMIAAAQALQKLGQEARVTAAWKDKVQAAAALIIKGQRDIQGAALTEYYSPLNDRAKAVTDECAAIVEKFPAADALTIAAVADSEQVLVVCVRKLKLIQVSLSIF